MSPPHTLQDDLCAGPGVAADSRTCEERILGECAPLLLARGAPIPGGCSHLRGLLANMDALPS
jgi:hypothetical protein